jgi:signal transduction histidine kinase/ligand-binding sensor domain-containing protein
MAELITCRPSVRWCFRRKVAVQTAKVRTGSFQKYGRQRLGWLRQFGLCLCFLLLAATTSALAVDPNYKISQYSHTAWRIQDGFLKGAAGAVTQTTDGYLWIASEAGLVRFDGVRFVPWSPPPGRQLLSSNITALLAARDGSLWIGTEGGLSHWTNPELVNYPRQPARVNSIFQDHKGTIWISRSRIPDNDGSLCRIIAAEMHCYGKQNGIPDDFAFGIATLTEDRSGNLWAAGTSALLRWKPNSSSVYKPAGLQSNRNQGGVQGLAANPDGTLWVGMALRGRGMGLQQLVQGYWKPFITPELDSSTLEVETLFLDRKNTLWVGTLQQGIYRIHDGMADHFSTADGLSSEHVYNFFEDREGDLWIATSKGIDRFRDFRVASFSTREGLSTAEVDSVLGSRDGTVWIGGYEGLDALRPHAISHIQKAQGLPGEQVTSLLEDHAGRLWVGIDNTLKIYKDGRFIGINRSDGTPTGMVVGMTEDVSHDVWVETTGPPRTLFRIQDLKVREEFPSPKMPPARKVAADPAGGIWLGLVDGDLARYRNGLMERFHLERVQGSRVDQIFVTSDGAVLGATASGLITWKNGKQQILGARNGLPCDDVRAFVFDGQGSLWLYLQCGLVEIANSELQKWFERPDRKLQVRLFDEFDGLQPGWPPFNGAARTPDGRLWFANGHVLQMVDPARLPRNTLKPLVRIEEVVADQKSYALEGPLTLPPLTRDLEIDYTALSFVIPQRVRFRHKLEGRDAEWQDSGTRRQAFYSDLPPGSYDFHIMASNNDGVWNKEGEILRFSIAPALYQTIWFRLACMGAAALLLWLLYQFRLRQLAAKFNFELEARLDERTRIARDLHDTLLQSFHGLMLRFQAAANLFPTRPAEAKQTLDSAIEEAALAVDASRDAIQGLRTCPVETTDLALALKTLGEEIASSGAIQSSAVFCVDVAGRPRNVHPTVRDEIYQIACEALRNAFRHAQARRIEVEIRYDNRQFRLWVRDDGKGFDQKILAGSAREGHFGLDGMDERAKLAGGKLEVWSKVDCGTEIELRIPASFAYAKSPSRPDFWLSRKLSGKAQ